MTDDNLTSVPPPAPADNSFASRPMVPTRSLAPERHVHARSRGTAVLDWVAFVLAFLVAPLGVVTGVVAVILGHRSNGWSSGIAKAAIGIGVVMSVALGGGYALFADVQHKQAAHDAVIASSARWCSELRATPGVLQSPTYDWPSEQNTVALSIVAMQGYVDHWALLEKVAPAGISAGTASIEKSAAGITSNVATSRVLDDSANQSTMARTVAASGVAAWVSQYCK
ncbi:MAG TPA: hypothetical protein VGM94_18200 [Galbitalea sp.]